MVDPNPIISASAFKWIITGMTGIVAGAYFFLDAYKLVRLMNADRRNPDVHDKRFGFGIGVLIGFIGVWGCLRFHGVV